jgi:hypothetical protein
MGGVPERLTQFMFIRKLIQKRKLCCHLLSPSQVFGESEKHGGLEEVAHACNPSNLEGGGWRIVVRPSLAELARSHLN